MRALHRVARIAAVASVLLAPGPSGAAVTRAIENGTQPIHMSADGRYVVYALLPYAPLDSPAGGIEFLDRLTGLTTPVAPVRVGPVGFTDPGDVSSYKGLAISPNGRVVAFANGSTTLVSPDANGQVWDVFVRDMDTGILTRESVSTAGVQANGQSAFPSLSADGRYVAFSSAGSNLVADDTNGRLDVFVRDRVTGTTERVNVKSDGSQSVGDISTINTGALFFCHCPAISADGRYVAFWSLAPDLVADDTNLNFDVFVHDRVTGATTRVSVKSDGSESHPYIGPVHVGISGNGRFVGFESRTNDLDPRKTSPHTVQGVFVHDRVTGVTELASLNSAGESANDLASGDPLLSYDGRFITFQSTATNLVADDTNGKVDVFLRDLVLGTTERVNVTSTGGQGGGTIDTYYHVSDDGRFVSFQNSQADLDPDRYGDAYVRDRSCANGTVDPSETCDDGNLIDTDACNTRCEPTGCPASVCGDGVVEGCEECDDGNALTGDCCNASCLWQGRNSGCTADGNTCTADACDGTGTCLHQVYSDGAFCDDGLFCNGQDQCSSGACTVHLSPPCAPVGECTGGCDEATDQCTADPTGAPCTDDGNPCSLDQCDSGGVCRHPTAAENTPCPDDGNACTEDKCDDGGECMHPALGDGATCDDGDECTVGDGCLAGQCASTPIVCPLCERCEPGAGCGVGPRAGCKRSPFAGKAQLVLQADASGGGDRVDWKWRRGEATGVAELGDPRADDAYAFCVYDPASLVVRLTAPAGALCGGSPCWSAIGSVPPKGFKYKDRASLHDGIATITMKAGATGQSKTKLHAGGDHVPALPPLDALTLPLTVQFQGESGACFEAEFTSAGVQRATPTLFRARSE